MKRQELDHCNCGNERDELGCCNNENCDAFMIPSWEHCARFLALNWPAYWFSMPEWGRKIERARVVFVNEGRAERDLRGYYKGVKREN